MTSLMCGLNHLFPIRPDRSIREGDLCYCGGATAPETITDIGASVVYAFTVAQP